MLIAFLILIGLFFLRVLLFHIETWLGPKAILEPSIAFNAYDIKLSYKNFMKFVNIASDKYTLFNDNGFGPCVKYSTLSRFYLIYFKSYISWVRVKYYFWEKEHADTSRQKIQTTKSYLNCVKADLEKYTGEHNL